MTLTIGQTLRNKQGISLSTSNSVWFSVLGIDIFLFIRDCLHEVGNLLWQSQHVSTDWYFWFNRANHSATDLSTALEPDISCQECLTRLQVRKQLMGATEVKIPRQRWMADLPGNQSSQASLLGGANQKNLRLYKGVWSLNMGKEKQVMMVQAS